MIAWLSANYVNLIAGAVVIGLVAVCARNVFSGKTGCSGNCGECSGSGACKKCR